MVNISEQRSVIEAFHKAMDQASFVLKENPELIFPQLYNRLQWKAKRDEALNKQLEDERSWYKKTWIRIISKPAESASLIRVFAGHSHWVRACAFSPDGKRIVTGDNMNQLLLLFLENILIYPAIATTYIQSTRLFFRCQYCQEINKIEESSLGQEVNCSSCGNKVKLNPFTIKLD